VIISALVWAAGNPLEAVHVQLSLKTGPLRLSKPHREDLFYKLFLVMNNKASNNEGRFEGTVLRIHDDIFDSDTSTKTSTHNIHTFREAATRLYLFAILPCVYQ